MNTKHLARNVLGVTLSGAWLTFAGAVGAHHAFSTEFDDQSARVHPPRRQG